MRTRTSLAVITAVAAGGLVACGGSSSSSGGSSSGSGAPYIGALAIVVPSGLTGVSPVQVQVCTDSTCATPISTATVTVNGSPVAWNATDAMYEGTTAVALGQAASLSVTYGGKTYTASGTQFTAAPTISSPLNPAGPASWNGAQANAVAWSGGMPGGSGAEYVFGVMDASGKVVYPAPTGSSSHGPMELAMGTMGMSVPANALPNGTYSLLVGIATTGAVPENGGGVAIPGAASGSGLWLGALASPVSVTVSGSAAGSGPFISAIAIYLPAIAGGSTGNVTICTDMTCATPVSGATVTMNGASLTWIATNHDYEGAPPLPLGGTVDVSVTLSGTTYSATGTMFTAPPTVSTPASGATWTASASNPITLTGGAPLAGADYLVGIATGTGLLAYPTGATGFLEVAPTASPTATVPANALASGSYYVIGGIATPGFSDHSKPGYSFGTVAAAGSGLWLGAVGTPTPITVSGATSGAPYITARVLTMPPSATIPAEMVQVCTDSTCTTPISTATVAVNGTALSWNATDSQYEGSVAVASGGAVTVTVAYGGTTYTASGTQFTSAPTITAPASGASWSVAAPQTISWTGGGPTAGAVYAVGILDPSSGGFVFPAAHNGPEEVSISTSSVTVPAGTLVSGNQYPVIVGIGTPGISKEQTGGTAFTPAGAAGSGLWLGNLSFALVTATP